MAETIYIRDASTAQIPFQLFADGVPIDCTSANKVEIILAPANGTGVVVKYNTTANPTVLGYLAQSEGRLGFTPNGTSDLTYANTPYKVFFWVYTTATAKYAVPDSDDLVIEVTNDYE